MRNHYRGKDGNFTSILHCSVAEIREKVEELLATSSARTYNEILMGFGYTTEPRQTVHKKLGNVLQSMKTEGLIHSEMSPSVNYHSMATNRYSWIDNQSGAHR